MMGPKNEPQMEPNIEPQMTPNWYPRSLQIETAMASAQATSCSQRKPESAGFTRSQQDPASSKPEPTRSQQSQPEPARAGQSQTEPARAYQSLQRNELETRLTNAVWLQIVLKHYLTNNASKCSCQCRDTPV